MVCVQGRECCRLYVHQSKTPYTWQRAPQSTIGGVWDFMSLSKSSSGLRVRECLICWRQLFGQTQDELFTLTLVRFYNSDELFNDLSFFRLILIVPLSNILSDPNLQQNYRNCTWSIAFFGPMYSKIYQYAKFIILVIHLVSEPLPIHYCKAM